MRLQAYLNELGETYSSWSRRAGIPTSTVRYWAQEEIEVMRTAAKIVAASHGMVKYEDLVPVDEKRA